MKAVVTGAAGFIGSHLARRLLADGHEVRAMIRPTSDRSLLDGVRCELVFGDLRDAASLRGVVEGADVVFHCAAALGAPTREGFDEVNVAGQRNIVAAVRETARAGLRFVHVSTIAAGGPWPGAGARNEDDPPAPVSNYGKSKLEGERITADLEGVAEYTILRPPIVYGPGALKMVPLFKAARRGVIMELAGARRPVTFIHVRDLVSGIAAAGTSPAAAGQTFHLIGPESGTLADFQRAMAAAMGVQPRTVRVPAELLQAAGWLADGAKRFVPMKTSFGTDKVRDGLAPSWTVSGEKAGKLLGFAPKLGFAEGLADTIADYRARGWL